MALTLQEIETKLEQIDSLPTLPSIAANLLEKLKTKTVSMTTISEVMENDPSITTKVLRIANSAYYSLRNRVDTIRMALVVLGVNEVTNIILGLSIFKAFEDTVSCESFNLGVFWKKSILTSQIARYLAKVLNVQTHGEEFTGGLIHGIGKLILFMHFKQEFLEIIGNSEAETLPLHVQEQTYLGITHMEVGAWLAGKWRLPTNLIDCIKFYHSPDASADNAKLVSLINLGDFYSKAILNDSLVEDYAEIDTLIGWKVLKGHISNINEDTFYRDLREEVQKAEDFARNLISM